MFEQQKKHFITLVPDPRSVLTQSFFLFLQGSVTAASSLKALANPPWSGHDGVIRLLVHHQCPHLSGDVLCWSHLAGPKKTTKKNKLIDAKQADRQTDRQHTVIQKLPLCDCVADNLSGLSSSPPATPPLLSPPSLLPSQCHCRGTLAAEVACHKNKAHILPAQLADDRDLDFSWRWPGISLVSFLFMVKG